MGFMNREQKFKIKKKLIALSFVEWDRFTESHDNSALVVFGWIERDKDSYKDFVTIEFNDKQEVVIWNTSSKEFSKKISGILDSDVPHHECQRVEKFFDIKNCIRLNEVQHE